MKKIVCMGGGNAMPKELLQELQKYPLEITTITSMVDSGGSAGALRKEFNVLPAGDIRRHILALSEAEEWKKKLFNFRFANDIRFDDDHVGHNFANVFIAGLEKTLGDFEKALEIVHQFMYVKGRCLPATLDKVNLYAKLENGTTLTSEDDIDVPRKRDGKLRVINVWLHPEAKAYSKALDAINEADIITFGPGDLYTSTIPCVLPKGMKEAISKSKAKKVFICNAMTKLGETYGYSIEDFVKEMENYIGTKLDFVIYNSSLPKKDRVEEYKKMEKLVADILLPKRRSLDKRFVGKDLLVESGPIEYDSKKVVSTILEINGLNLKQG